mmetsp:Transcript_20658/g.52433  ORF Transcript_20658/g.52433 Transcript_20658/m.52433 type:complete len:508 (-) Transcript_20658:442-1965(-)
MGKTLTWITIGVGSAALLYGGSKLLRYVVREWSREALMQEYRKAMVSSIDQLKELQIDFIKQLEDGLTREVETDGRHMLMLPTYITRLPDGCEAGDVYAIDLGGTNFRVMRVALGKGQPVHPDMREVPIPRAVYKGTGTALFDFLATTLAAFIAQHSGPPAEGAPPPVVGFCFSFPTAQSALDRGTLVDWTKEFECSGVKGEDVVRLLSDALVRAGRPCRVAALLNDTVGVLTAHRYHDPAACVGVIIGTGTNACYVEDAGRMTKWTPAGGALPKGTQTVVNIEWGAFWSDRLPRHPGVDDAVDARTPHAGRYMFEKLLSGMFLGEVARGMLLRLAANAELFGDPGRDPNAARVVVTLVAPGVWQSSHVTRCVEDDSRLLEGVGDVVREVLGIGADLAPYSSRRLVKEVCEIVALRSAQLTAMALSALLTHTGWAAAAAAGAPAPTTIAFDGGVYEHFGAYRATLADWLRRLVGPEAFSHIKLVLAADGSCLGAAVVAAAAARGGQA